MNLESYFLDHLHTRTHTAGRPAYYMYRARNRNCPPFTTVEGDSSSFAPCSKENKTRSPVLELAPNI